MSIMEGVVLQNKSFMATECQRLGCISLPTVPIIVKNGFIKKLLLDDGNTQTCLNADIVANLSLYGKTEKSSQCDK